MRGAAVLPPSKLMQFLSNLFSPNDSNATAVTSLFSSFSNGVLWAADSPNILPTGLGAFGNYYFNGSLSSVDNLFQIDVSVPVSLNVNYGLIPFFFIIFFILRFFKNALL